MKSKHNMHLRPGHSFYGAILILMVSMILINSSCRKADNQKLYEDLENSPIVESDIHLIGDVHTIPATSQQLFVPDNINSGAYAYASSIRLNDSTVMVACTRFRPNGFDDFKHSDIVARLSTNNGESWQPEYVLQQNIAAINTMNPNLVRLTDKKLALIFLLKHSGKNIDLCISDSNDNGLTWSAPRIISQIGGYHVLNNDRVIYNNGRLIVPVAYCANISTDYDKQFIFCYYSDDMGKTWLRSNYLKSTFALMEPGITAIGNNGTLKMNIRTKQGVIYFSTSTDNGKTWKGLISSNINALEAPQVVVSLHKSDSLVMIWNNRPYVPGTHNRNPLTFTYSIDGGNQWKNPTNLRDNKEVNYLYPTIYNDRNDTIFVTYAELDKRDRSVLYFDRLSLKKLIK